MIQKNPIRMSNTEGFDFDLEFIRTSRWVVGICGSS